MGTRSMRFWCSAAVLLFAATAVWADEADVMTLSDAVPKGDSKFSRTADNVRKMDQDRLRQSVKEVERAADHISAYNKDYRAAQKHAYTREENAAIKKAQAKLQATTERVDREVAKAHAELNAEDKDDKDMSNPSDLTCD